MFCSFCGKELADEVNSCSSCGQPLPRAEHAADPAATPEQVAPPAVKSAPRMPAAGVVWCAICLAANLALAILGIVALSAQRGGNAAGIVAIIATFVAAFGFVMLLFANREGLYVLCLAALVGVVTNFAVGSWINALFGVLNPVITWLFIRNLWEKMGQPFETPRSRRTALILASIPYTGWFGLDRLYLGYGWLGFLKAITCGGMLVWYVIDIVKLARNRMRDGFDQPLCWRSGSPSPIQRAQSKGKALRVWGIVLISMGLVVGINGVVQVSFGGSYKSVGDFITGPILFIGVGIFLLLRGLKRAAQQ